MTGSLSIENYWQGRSPCQWGILSIANSHMKSPDEATFHICFKLINTLRYDYKSETMSVNLNLNNMTYLMMVKSNSSLPVITLIMRNFVYLFICQIPLWLHMILLIYYLHDYIIFILSINSDSKGKKIFFKFLFRLVCLIFIHSNSRPINLDIDSATPCTFLRQYKADTNSGKLGETSNTSNMSFYFFHHCLLPRLSS